MPTPRYILSATAGVKGFITTPAVDFKGIQTLTGAPIFMSDTLFFRDCHKTLLFNFLHPRTFPNARNIFIDSYPAYEIIYERFHPSKTTFLFTERFWNYPVNKIDITQASMLKELSNYQYVEQ